MAARDTLETKENKTKNKTKRNKTEESHHGGWPRDPICAGGAKGMGTSYGAMCAGGAKGTAGAIGTKE
eukprot:12426533-Karenia_brevis.AAC.1